MLDWADFTIAEATAADSEVLLALRDEAAAWLQSLGIDQWHTGERPVAEWGHEGHGVYVLRHGADVAGTVTLVWEDPAIWGEQPVPAGYVHNLVVARSFAGQGLGRRLLQWAEDQVVSAGRSVVRLDCGAQNSLLRELYESAGYHWVRDKEFEGLPADQAVALFEKVLRPL